MSESAIEICTPLNPYLDFEQRIRMLEDSTASIEYRKKHMIIKKVIFNCPATIVLWEDGTKTVVKSGDYDVYDPEKGLAMAIAKKTLGNKGNYYNIFKKYLPKEDSPIYDHTYTNPFETLGERLKERLVSSGLIERSNDETKDK